MSQTQMLEQLKAGNIQAVIEALEENQAAYEQWANEQEAAEAWAIARELNSTPELLEECPF